MSHTYKATYRPTIFWPPTRRTGGYLFLDVTVLWSLPLTAPNEHVKNLRGTSGTSTSFFLVALLAPATVLQSDGALLVYPISISPVFYLALLLIVWYRIFPTAIYYITDMYCYPDKYSTTTFWCSWRIMLVPILYPCFLMQVSNALVPYGFITSLSTPAVVLLMLPLLYYITLDVEKSTRRITTRSFSFSTLILLTLAFILFFFL